MAYAKQQHFVPRLLLKRFVSSEGHLYRLQKRAWRVGENPSHIKTAASGDEYYGPPGNFVDNRYTELENDFKEAYSRILVSSKVSLVDFEKFMRFTAAQFARTSFLASGEAHPHLGLTLEPALWAQEGGARRLVEMPILATFASEGWEWCRFESSDPSPPFVITDHPACFVPLAGRVVMLFPLSPRVLYIGGADSSIENAKGLTPMQLNAFLLGAATESVYSGSLKVLQSLADQLAPEHDEVSDGLRARFRQPGFGLPAELCGAAPSAERLTQDDLLREAEELLVVTKQAFGLN